MLVALAALFSLGMPYPVQAARPAQAIESLPPLDSSARPIDVVVLLDDSGSMATCWPWPQDRPPFEPPCGAPSPNLPSDPDELRYSAARLLLQLVDAQDRVAVVRFDSNAGGVGELGTLRPVGPPTERSTQINSLQPPDSYGARGYTRIDLGLDQAIAQLSAVREPGRSQYVLLLTDGEPSQQGDAPNQRERIGEQIRQLADDDVYLFPVVLCNPTAGCAGDFLREQFADGRVKEAATASELLRVFSEILAAMKPDRSISGSRDEAGALQLTARSSHGVEQLAFVTPRSDLLSVKLDGAPILPVRQFDDPNVDVNVVTGDQLADGVWTANTGDLSGFTVVRAASYPLLLNPPPSVAGSQASIHYYPAGSRPLILAAGVGPGADEPIFYNGETELQPFGRDDLRAIVPAEAPSTVRLQLGADRRPLQLVRTFQLEARADLPRLEILSPLSADSGLTAEGRLLIEAAFGGSGADNPAATVYITDQSEDQTGDGQLVYQTAIQCSGRLCTDSGFSPVDGRSYRITVVAEGDAGGVRFGDWAQHDLALAPAVYLRGLPAQIDLAQMPAEGWPVELASGTLEEIGELTAAIALSPVDSNESIPGVTLDFAEEVPEEGAVQTALRVDGIDALRPGTYQGQITLAAKSPAGLPLDVKIRPGTTLPVTLVVPRPQVRLDSQLVDFGAVQFDTSPNFRVRQEVLVPASFSGAPFAITARSAESACANLSVAAGELQRRGSRLFLPLTLRSSEAVPPGTCRGKILLSGPDTDHDVLPASMDWQMRVDAVEWSLVGGQLAMGDLQDAGSRADGVVLVRFNGKTPFVIQANELTLNGSTPTGPRQLTTDELELPPVEVTWEPNAAGVYEIPLALIARSRIAGDRWRGTYYAGQIGLQIAGLSGVQTIGASLRSPSIVQRYAMPVVRPLYGMPQALCTVPLSLLLLLVAVARIRGRRVNEEELEEAAAATVMQTQTVEPVRGGQPVAQAGQSFVAAAPTSADTVWGASQWGSPWATSPAEEQTTDAGIAGSGGPERDPWNTSW